MENTKICSKCGRELPLECFSKDKSKKDGLQVHCKECQKQYYAEHAEAKKQYFKQWRAEHAEYNKQYYADNVEYFKQWRADNAEYFKQYRAEYYSTIEGYARCIRNANLRKDRMYGRIGAEEDPLPSVEEYIELLQQRDFYDGKQYHWSEMGLDRIDNTKPHTKDNVVPCSTEHNVQRGRKTFEEFLKIMKG